MLGEWWGDVVWPRAFLPQDKKKIGAHTFQMRQLFLKVTQVQDGCPLICVLHNILKLVNSEFFSVGKNNFFLFFSEIGWISSLWFVLKNPFQCCISCVDQQGPVENPELSCVPGSTTSLSTVLLNYNRLISGKLERFMIKLEDRCTPLWQKDNFIGPGVLHLPRNNFNSAGARGQ